MKRAFAVVLGILITITVGSVDHTARVAGAVSPVHGQEDEAAARILTRQRLAELLDKVGPGIDVSFTQSQKQPFNYVGSLRAGLVNLDFFEIVISITAKNTIGFRIYPHYNKGYINVDKVKNPAAFMRQLLRLSDRAFLYWGADEAGDVFTGYTFTLESGFPAEAIKIVLRSIVNSDKFIGELRPSIDGSSAAGTVK